MNDEKVTIHTPRSRYFIEVTYDGSAYAGVQIQKNSESISTSILKSLNTYFKKRVLTLVPSSRTDKGVHALANVFHFDLEGTPLPKDSLSQITYHLNALLPADIAIKNMLEIPLSIHARFSATNRYYQYKLYKTKNPFLKNTGWYYPYDLDISVLQTLAKLIFSYRDFTAFSKKHTQTFTNNCTILKSYWETNEETITYHITANRFLRGMVRALVATMLKAGRKKISINDFIQIMENKKIASADFSAPPHGLTLIQVNYPNTIPTIYNVNNPSGSVTII